MLLLIERKNDPGKGLYDLPGGFVDYGETLEQGMKRELKEEIGIAPKNLKYYSSKPKQYLKIYSELQKKMRFIKDSIEIELNKETKEIMDSLKLVK